MIPKIPLSELVHIDRNAVQPEAIADGTRYVGLDCIETGGRILRVDEVSAGELASSKFAFDDRHILFGKLRPNLAKVARPDFSGICSTDILPIRPRSDVDRDYLAHYLLSPEAVAWATSRTSGANLPRLSPTVLGTLPVPLPPLPEQRRIASILDEAQTLRRLAENRVVLLEEIVGSAFRATQASASLARVRLSDIAEVVGGSTPKSGVAELWDGDIPWITPADLSKNADLVISKTARTISDQGLRSIGNRLLPPGAVLLSSRAPIGLVGIVGVPMATNQGFKSLIPDAEIVDSTYLYWWLRANRATLERRGVGATFKELSKTVVESIELALPPIEEQREFGRLARDAEEARLRAFASLSQVQLLTDSLQARAFRGEL